MVRLERATSASGVRQAAPVFSSPAPKIPFAEAPRAHDRSIWRPPVRRSPACRPKKYFGTLGDRERRRRLRALLSPATTSDQSKSSHLTFWGYADLAFPIHRAIDELDRGEI